MLDVALSLLQLSAGCLTVSSVGGMNAIPVIDLALPHADVAAQVYDACTSVGFFYGAHICQ